MHRDEAWKGLGACSDDPSFEDFPDRTNKKDVEYAKSVCKKCPVRPECLAYAFLHNITEGIWGGGFVEDRRMIGSILNLSRSMSLDDLSDRLRNQFSQNSYSPTDISYTDISVEFEFEKGTQTLRIASVDLEFGSFDF